MDSEVPVLRTERLTLTIPGARAAEAFVQFMRENQAHLSRWDLARDERDFDVAFWRETLDRHVEHFRNGTRYAFCLFDAATGADGPFLGYVTFTEVVRGVFLACYMGYALAESAQGTDT